MKKRTLATNTAAALFGAAMCVTLSTEARAGTVQIDLVPVGDVMNLADTSTGFGSVSYAYSMGKYDVTTAQYTAFLNAVATSADPYSLYNSKMATDLPTFGITRTSTSAGFTYALKGAGNVPAFDVTWASAARFCNWLQNGEPTGIEGGGTTETGSYALNGSTGSAALMAVTRSTSATWVLPTVDEWYKASYYAGGGTNAGYWVYPTQSNSQPSNVFSATGTNNANYAATNFTDPINFLTPVGAFAASPGPYGTFDTGGDVWQWEQTLVFGGPYREIRGGSYASDVGAFNSSEFSGGPMETPGVSVGFRVAYVPEPCSAALFSSAALATLIFLLSRRYMKNERSKKCCADSYLG